MNLYIVIHLSDYKGGEIYHVNHGFKLEEILEELEVTEFDDIKSLDGLKNHIIRWYKNKDQLYGDQIAIYKNGSRLSWKEIAREITDDMLKYLNFKWELNIQV